MNGRHGLDDTCLNRATVQAMQVLGGGEGHDETPGILHCTSVYSRFNSGRRNVICIIFFVFVFLFITMSHSLVYEINFKL